MNKKDKIQNAIMIFLSIIFIVSLIMYFNTKTEYATITGESFNIPKIEGNGYFERGEDL